MKMKRKIVILLIYLLLTGIVFLSCNPDKNLTNPNAADTDRILSDPEYVESLLEGLFLQWWNSNQGAYPAMGLSIAADEATSQLVNGNLNREPRRSWNNSESSVNRYFVETPWYGMYKAILDSNDILKALDNGTLSVDINMVSALCNFTKGLSYGFLALFFDQAAILDQNTDLETHNFTFESYSEVMETAVVHLLETIDIANKNSFNIPDNWINGLAINNEDLCRIAHSYIARFMAQVGRDQEERTSVNWGIVINHIEQAIDADFAPIGDGELYYDKLKYYSNFEGLIYIDYKTLGPADTSGAYLEWLEIDPSRRKSWGYNIDIHTRDKRITGGNFDIDGTDFRYRSDKAHYYSRVFDISRYNYKRYAYYYPDKTGSLPILTVREMNLLKAEALIRLGMPGAADLINITRVGRGELPPAADDDPDLFAKMKYEKRIECMFTASGLAFFDDRGWGELTPGTPIHFPVPAKELNILRLPVYTFGGSGEGSAPRK